MQSHLKRLNENPFRYYFLFGFGVRACVRARVFSHIHWLVSFACLAVHCRRRHILMFTASTTSGKLAIKFELLFLNLFAECVRNGKKTTRDSFDSVKER